MLLFKYAILDFESTSFVKRISADWQKMYLLLNFFTGIFTKLFNVYKTNLLNCKEKQDMLKTNVKPTERRLRQRYNK